MKAWHSREKINEDHFPVVVVFNRRPPSQDCVSKEKKPIAIIEPETIQEEVSLSEDKKKKRKKKKKKEKKVTISSPSLSPGTSSNQLNNVEDGEEKGEKEKGGTVSCSEEELNDDHIIDI